MSDPAAPLPALHARRLCFEIEVELGVEPLTGVIRVGGAEHRFAGWMALVAALDRITGQPDGAGPGACAPEPA